MSITKEEFIVHLDAIVSCLSDPEKATILTEKLNEIPSPVLQSFLGKVIKSWLYSSYPGSIEEYELKNITSLVINLMLRNNGQDLESETFCLLQGFIERIVNDMLASHNRSLPSFGCLSSFVMSEARAVLHQECSCNNNLNFESVRQQLTELEARLEKIKKAMAGYSVFANSAI